MIETVDIDPRSIEIINEFKDLPGACLPILHALQEEFGYVPEGAIPHVAEALNLSRAEVHGVLTFYKDFRSNPPGRRVVKLCRAESCQAMGADALAREAESALGIPFGTTRDDGRVTLEAVYCLGNCALSPAAVIDNEIYGRLTADHWQSLLAPMAKGAQS